MSDTDGMSTDEFDGPMGEDWKVFSPDNPDFNLRIQATDWSGWMVGYDIFDGSARPTAIFYSADGAPPRQEWFNTLADAEAFVRNGGD